MIDISEVFDHPELLTDFQIRRTIGGFQDEGRWVKAPPTILARSGSVQAAKAIDMINYLPEGERQKNSITVYSNQDILMANGNDQESDIILLDGEEYRVAYSKNWSRYGHWFAIATGYQTNG